MLFPPEASVPRLTFATIMTSFLLILPIFLLTVLALTSSYLRGSHQFRPDR